MLLSKRSQIVTGLVWLFILPVVTSIAYSVFPIVAIDWLYVLLLFSIMCVVMALPVQVEEVSIPLERWITIAIFLRYGMLVEFVFIQLALIVLLFSTQTSFPTSHRFFVNSINFSVTSLISALLFKLFGGEVHSLQFLHVVFYGFLYGTVYSLVYNSLLKLYFVLAKKRRALFLRAALWDFVSTLVMVPMSIALYFLNEYVGDKSILLIGIPLLVLLIAIHRYNESNTRQKQLSYATEIGRELANKLLFSEVMQAYLEKLRGVVRFEKGYVVDLRSEKSLIPLMSIENGTIHHQVKSIVFTKDKEKDDGLDLNRTKIYTDEELTKLKNVRFEEEIYALMSIPIIRDERTEGFLLLTSTERNVFHREDIQIIEILTSYFAVSLEKASHFERTLHKSERCGLTNLHNYRYLDRQIEELIKAYYTGAIESLSIILLDIDFFKKVNDTYGHENGNIVLIELAQILQKYEKENDLLARYGGEEFVFAFPNCSKEEAIAIAEEIRKEVEQTKFTITPDLGKNRKPVDLSITISLGVATLPTDAIVASDLLRNADLALYVDGKQAGRNRVGVFGNFKTKEKHLLTKESE